MDAGNKSSAHLSVSLAYKTALCNFCDYSVVLWHMITQYVYASQHFPTNKIMLPKPFCRG